MPRLILFNKPYGVLWQFSDDGSGKLTLAQYVKVPKICRAIRLDPDSGALLETSITARRSSAAPASGRASRA